MFVMNKIKERSGGMMEHHRHNLAHFPLMIFGRVNKNIAHKWNQKIEMKIFEGI